MFDTIVVATDGSANADRAVSVAAKLAAACGARLTLVHVAPTYLSLADAEQVTDLSPEARADIKKIRETMGGFEISGYAPVPAPQSAIEHIGNAVLDRAESLARENGPAEIDRILRFGDPAEGVVEEAERIKAELIVVGTRGLSDLGALVMGSVSHKVIQLADCPCVTVK
ncbi:MAG: universal stress protein [Alphaproteobacteria bacterium]|nr:universal stress protein [Alphaproteobacteria bacterium]